MSDPVTYVWDIVGVTDADVDGIKQAVTSKFESGVTAVEVDVGQSNVSVTTTLTPEEIEAVLKETGKEVSLKASSFDEPATGE